MMTHTLPHKMSSLVAVAALTLLGLACQRGGENEPSDLPSLSRDHASVVVVGIDGAEWSVIRRLWAENRLPNLRRLAEGGIAAPLATAYGASPVIWTTIATGRAPQDHGITDFVVTTERGTVPISSSVRRVPALWNMTSRAGLRTAVLGWWASWPAEEIDGVIVTDRAHLSIDRIVYPESYLPDFQIERKRAWQEYPGLGGRLPSSDIWMEDGASRDRIMAHEARRLVGLGFDLFLVYFRSVDIASHRYWKYFEPDRYKGVAQEEIDSWSHVIPTVYEATDEALGDLLAACPEGSLVFVLSDHGFLAGPEQHFVNLNMDRLLEHLGFLVRDGDSVDFARSVAYPVDSPNHAQLKKIRLSLAGRETNGRVSPGEASEELDRLIRALEGVRYQNGGPVFRIRRSDLPPDIDLIAEVSLEEPSLEVHVSSESLDDIVLYINRISGTHNENTQGIFIAWGPDIDPDAQVDGISVLDITPTILNALGLPVADDFAGRPWRNVFTEVFRSRHPLRSVASWGTMETWGVETSPVDEKLVEELRALGYLN